MRNVYEKFKEFIGHQPDHLDMTAKAEISEDNEDYYLITQGMPYSFHRDGETTYITFNGETEDIGMDTFQQHKDQILAYLQQVTRQIQNQLKSSV